MGQDVSGGRVLWDVIPDAAEEQAIRGREESGLDNCEWWVEVKTPIGSTPSTHHGRHELQPRHPQLHGRQQNLLVFVHGV